MPSNQALQAPPRHWLRMPGYPRSKTSLGAPERDRQAHLVRPRDVFWFGWQGPTLRFMPFYSP